MNRRQTGGEQVCTYLCDGRDVLHVEVGFAAGVRVAFADRVIDVPSDVLDGTGIGGGGGGGGVRCGGGGGVRV